MRGWTKDLTGQRFGRLVVLKFAHYRDYPEGGKIRKRAVFTCQCDCGEIKDIPAIQLGKGTTSCGCLLRETAAAKGRKSALPLGVAARNRVLDMYTRSAKNRGYEFDLPISEFNNLLISDCYYCGCKPSNKSKSTNNTGEFYYNGIDRLDNTIGYISGNCVPCCERCNTAKNNRSASEFIDWIKKIYSHLT